MNYPIVLIAANRFDYFTQVVDALAPQVGKRDFFLFLDRSLKGEVDLRHVDYIKRSGIKNANLIVRDSHYGCGRNIIDARRTVFDSTACKALQLFEDDMVPASNYVEKNESLFDQKTVEFSNVGATQLWKMCFLTHEEKVQRKGELWATFDSLLGYIMSRRCWNDISPFLYEYEGRFLAAGGDYRLRPHQDIWRWIIGNHIFQPRYLYPLQYVLNKDEEEERKKYMARFITGQDGVTIHTMHIRGWVRLSPIVNYGKYVGEYGVHHHPNLFKEQGYDKIEMFED